MGVEVGMADKVTDEEIEATAAALVASLVGLLKAHRDRWVQGVRRETATAALQGLLAHNENPAYWQAENAAINAVRFADALLSELEK